MDEVTHVELARAEGARGEVVLRERREGTAPPVLELRVNGVYVMDTRETRTEEALAEVALAVVSEPREVLVGGLGLGATARRVLDDPRVERCTVVEVEQVLVDWLRGGVVPQGPALLADQRLRVVVADVVEACREAADASYDLVLLDVDNGPDHLVHEANAVVYEPPFLAEVRRLLRAEGALAVWSASRSAPLEAALGAVFASVTAEPQPVRLGERDETYWLHVARGSRPLTSTA